MKRIDTNVFFGRWPFRRCGEEDMAPILRRCRGNGVDGILVSSVHSIFYEDPFEAEEELHRAIADLEGVYHVYSVNPRSAGWKEDLRTARESFDIRALKVFPGYHGYPLLGPEMAEVCQMARQYDLPLILSMRVEDERVAYLLYQKPLPLDHLGMFLGTYRENTIILSNISFGEVMGLRPNILSRDRIYVDTAGFKFISFPLEKLLAVYPQEMFLFGSQCPLYIQRSILNEITREKLSPQTQQVILHDNAVRVFRLEN